MALSASQQFFERLWYRPTVWWLWLFLPLQLLLRLVVFLRRTAYRQGVFTSTQLSRPVVVIGNINVGGTGKTPLAIYILEWLQSQGFKPGLVTRGYGGQTENYPLLVEEGTTTGIAGDEPVLIYRRTDAHVVVDPVRSRGGQKLIELGCDIVICDDGLQHYALQRDLEIAVIDGARQFGNGWLMPMGPLREPESRLSSVDLRVVNGDSMKLKPQAIQPLDHQKSLESKTIHAVAAIGNPGRFFDTLRRLGYEVTPHEFPDHHQYSAKDFQNLSGPIVMTEKDAVKCHDFADERLYYLPVETQLSEPLAQELQAKLLSLLKS